MFDQKNIILNMTKNEKGPKLNLDFFLEKKILLRFFFWFYRGAELS